MFFIEKIPVKTLKKIEEDIKNNDLGKARDRLHGLISSYPDELELRKKLGDIYFELKYPSMAGRYWYLEENKTPEMVKACIEFEKSMGKDPKIIARALKYKGNIEILKRLELDQAISSIKNKVKEKLVEEPDNALEDKLVTFGCLSIIFLIIIFTLIGVYAVFRWIFCFRINLIRGYGYREFFRQELRIRAVIEAAFLIVLTGQVSSTMLQLLEVI